MDLQCKDRPCGETFGANIIPAGTILAPKADSNSNSVKGGQGSERDSVLPKGKCPQNESSLLERMNEFVEIGQTMGFDMGGCLGQKAKKQWVRELCCKNKISFLSLQETKMEEMEDNVVRSLWGNMDFDYSHSPSVGFSGGILCVWNKSCFSKCNEARSDYFVLVEGVWKQTGTKLLIIGVYAPQDLSEKKLLWDYLHGVLSRWQGESIVMGDFNEVRVPSERHGSVFNKQGASLFNSFINSSNLIDVPLGVFSFTWALKNATKMSKLDRFLVSEGLLCRFPAMMGIILTRNLSDHRTILLKECDIDYGPTPFKMFPSWFDIEGFDQMVKDAWNSEDVDDTNEMVYLKKKLKKRISSWVHKNRSISIEKRKAILDKLFKLDKQLDQEGGQENLLNARRNLWKDFRVLDDIRYKDLEQKAKVKWDIEECSNCKHLLGKITVLEATVEMYMHPEQHTLNSTALLHEVYNDMGKLDLE
ncbi:RNA-directed DNA polymerase, eukaryota [Tanacetum coccineum]|uniref:RNA-directed DNA polymerase, eukaryota n=1 Tax=Tanacetum coccineum TaxID=301880 RepID=A0ABQ5CM97_9ASTR